MEDLAAAGRALEGQGVGAAGGVPGVGGGRTIRAGTFQLALLCPQAGTNPFTTQIADAPLPRAKIAPDGSFVFAGVVSKHASFVHGRIQGRRAKGTASLSLGVCSGSAKFSAKRK